MAGLFHLFSAFENQSFSCHETPGVAGDECHYCMHPSTGRSWFLLVSSQSGYWDVRIHPALPKPGQASEQDSLASRALLKYLQRLLSFEAWMRASVGLVA